MRLLRRSPSDAVSKINKSFPASHAAECNNRQTNARLQGTEKGSIFSKQSLHYSLASTYTHMKTRYWIITSALIFTFVFALFILRPVPIPDEKDCISLTGTVTSIYEEGIHDVAFRLSGQEQIFYINRGLERGLDLENLRATLTDQEVVIKYPQYWTPLDPGNQSRHISKIEHKGETVFSELD